MRDYGCDVAGVLQAAHIVPYMGTQSNATDNGLLLRADIHNLLIYIFYPLTQRP